MARVPYAHAAEVNGQYVERRVGGALEQAAQPPGERIGAERRHAVYHHAARAAAAKGFHQRRGQCPYPVGRRAELRGHPRNAPGYPVHNSGGAENANANKYGHEVRNYAHGRLEASLCALDESVVNVNLLPYSHCYEQHND